MQENWCSDDRPDSTLTVTQLPESNTILSLVEYMTDNESLNIQTIYEVNETDLLSMFHI